MIDDAVLAALELAVDDARVAARYRGLLHGERTASGCTPWLGAISAQGSGRFWLSAGRVVVAHRYGFALTFGVDALGAAPQIAHRCDEAWCQTPEHWEAATGSQNTQDWIRRREHLGSPLRDLRGARGRAEAVRAAARRGASLAEALMAGAPEVDRLQDHLPGLEVLEP